MYNFIYIISALIRQFLLPNPYINFFKEEMYANIFNIIIGGFILHELSFWLTGMGYKKGINKPVTGSICYLICYVILTLIITFIGRAITDLRILFGIFLIIYISLCFLVRIIFNKFSIFSVIK